MTASSTDVTPPPPSPEAARQSLALRTRRLVSIYPHYALLVAMMLIGLAGIPFATWVTLTVAGIGMGLMIFVMASGMTLTFGLMDVLNLGHGALITVGAFLGATLVTGFETGLWPLKLLSGWKWAPAQIVQWDLGAASVALLAVLIVTGLIAARHKGGSTRYLWLSFLPGAILAAIVLGGGQALQISGGAFARPALFLLALILAALSGAIIPRVMSRGAAARKPDRRSGRGRNAVQGLIGGAILLASLALLARWPWSTSFIASLGIIVPAFILAFVGVGAVGYLFERLIVRPVYRDPLKQILVTVGAAYIIGELLKALWGPDLVTMTKPGVLEGGISFGAITVEKYRLLAAVIGLAIYWLLNRTINRTRIGLLIRAGVENTEMVEALGYRIRLLFIAVFVAGAALAGVGGVMWGLYQSAVGTDLGAEMLVLIIIVIIIGGMGSISGCFYGALLVGLLNNYTIYMVPKVALFSSIGLMILVLMWRPQGLRPVK